MYKSICSNQYEFSSFLDVNDFTEDFKRFYNTRLNHNKLLNFTEGIKSSLMNLGRPVRAYFLINEYLLDYYNPSLQANSLGLTGVNGISGDFYCTGSISEKVLNHPCQQEEKNKELLLLLI